MKMPRQLNVVASADTQAVDTDATHFPPATLDVFEDVSLDELLKTYEGWGPDVIKLLSCTANISKWKINLVYPHLKPEQWAKDRVAILGDAVRFGLMSTWYPMLICQIGTCDASQSRCRRRSRHRGCISPRKTPGQPTDHVSKR